jgi:hypothetical protein
LFESAVDLLVITMLAQVLDRLIRYRKEAVDPPMTAETTAMMQHLLTEGWSNLEPHQTGTGATKISVSF